MRMKAPADFGVDDASLTEVVVRNDLRAVRPVADQIMRAVSRCGYDSDTAFAIKLALEEAITNAVKHGNCNDPSKELALRWLVDRERVVIMVRDEGCGFCPEDVPDPTLEENIERPSGRGIMLMHSYMTKIRFNAAGNEVWLLKEKEV